MAGAFEAMRRPIRAELPLFETGKEPPTKLVKPGQGNIWQYIRRKVSPAQEDFVASNDLSLIGAFAVREDGYTALPFGLAENGEPWASS